VVPGDRVLLVDDDVSLQRALTIALKAAGFEVRATGDGQVALGVLSEFAPDVVVIDLGLPGVPGLDVIGIIRSLSFVPIVVLSARDERASRSAALAAGAGYYVAEPVALAAFVEVLRRVLDRGRTADRMSSIHQLTTNEQPLAPAAAGARQADATHRPGVVPSDALTASG
jgi:DNA-binding response OmpR family regulator